MEGRVFYAATRLGKRCRSMTLKVDSVILVWSIGTGARPWVDGCGHAGFYREARVYRKMYGVGKAAGCVSCGGGDDCAGEGACSSHRSREFAAAGGRGSAFAGCGSSCEGAEHIVIFECSGIGKTAGVICGCFTGGNFGRRMTATSSDADGTQWIWIAKELSGPGCVAGCAAQTQRGRGVMTWHPSDGAGRNCFVEGFGLRSDPNQSAPPQQKHNNAKV